MSQKPTGQPAGNPHPTPSRANLRVSAPYGLSFEIVELLQIGAWARGRGYQMSVALDQVRGGAEFEEMVMLSEPGRRGRRLHLWRTQNRVFTQIPGSAPRSFSSLGAALEAQGQAAPRRGGLFGLFW